MSSQPTGAGSGSPSKPTSRSPSSSPLSMPAQSNQHRPAQPSGLRQTHIPPGSPDRRIQEEGIEARDMENGEHGSANKSSETASVTSDHSAAQGGIEDPSQAPNVRSRLLEQLKTYHSPNCEQDNCSHGETSPRPRALRGYGSFMSSESAPRSPGDYGGPPPDDVNSMADTAHMLLPDAVTDRLLSKPNGHQVGPTTWLAERHGIKRLRLQYIFYYLPCMNWMKQYRWQYLQGDLIAALTMASFYIPMALSYASNLGHIPPINGLYSFVFNPLLYAILGTCPQMVVGPEAAGSLLTGSVVREAINRGHHQDKESQKSAEVAGMVTGLAGAIILGAGLCRLGFLDSVLSRPFLRGFISAIGIVIIIDQLIPEMGLDSAAAHSESAAHGSSMDKLLFLGRHGHEASAITCAVAFGSFAIVMVCREIKRRLQPKMEWVAYIPDRFAVVVLSAVLTWKYSWDKQGLDILGDIKAHGTPFNAHFPFEPRNFKHIDDAFGTAMLIALLGFFESSVAAKSLGAGVAKAKTIKNEDGEEEPLAIKNVQISANRELVALGVANIVGGSFMALPAFGGYGRSKVNSSTGGRTPMSSIFLSLITVICVLFLLPYFYYIPKAVLCAMISVVAWSLIEEAPHDILFFWRISGYSELSLMFIIFLTTFFWNLRVGIAAGIGLSLLRLLRHSARPRIQILGRDPETKEFESAELKAGELEFIPHCLIVKIPEPLTFANTGSLKDRLRKLEDYGTNEAHPALPRVRNQEQNRNIIFDVHGVTAMDPAASQVLLEIVTAYKERGTRVIFCRVPSRRTEVWRLMVVSGIVELCGGEQHFVKRVDDALKLTEFEEEIASLSRASSSRVAPQPEHDAIAGSFDGADAEERRVGK